MPKTFPVKIEVEEIALGTVLRKLHEMPGVVKFDIDFGHGGQGAGRARLEQAASTDPQEIVVKAMMAGPISPKQVKMLIGGPDSRAYKLLADLAKAGISRKVSHGKHELIQRQSAGGVALALPAPSGVSRGPSGRASPGAASVLIAGVLRSEGAMSATRLSTFLGNNGMSPKSISGVLSRAKAAGLIKKGPNGYELTAKGGKLNGEAHG